MVTTVGQPNREDFDMTPVTLQSFFEQTTNNKAQTCTSINNKYLDNKLKLCKNIHLLPNNKNMKTVKLCQINNSLPRQRQSHLL